MGKSERPSAEEGVAGHLSGRGQLKEPATQKDQMQSILFGKTDGEESLLLYNPTKNKML